MEIMKIGNQGAQLAIVQINKNLSNKDAPLILSALVKSQKYKEKKIISAQDLCTFIHGLNYEIYRIYKDSSNKLINLKKENSLGTYDDNLFADHLLIHDSKINTYEKLITEN